MDLKKIIAAFEDCIDYTSLRKVSWYEAIQAGKDMITNGIPLDHDEIIEVEEVRKELWCMFGDTPHAVELSNITGKLYRLTHRK